MIIGTSQHNQYFDWIAHRILLVAVCLLFFVSSGWGACTPYTAQYEFSSSYTTERCSSIMPWNSVYCYTFKGSSFSSSHECYVAGTSSPILNRGDCGRNCGYQSCSYSCWTDCYYCSSPQEADSLKCVLNPSAPGCKTPQQECEESGLEWVDDACVDPTNCAPYREECESYGGKFTGHPVPVERSPTGCLSFCSMCNSVAMNNYRRALSKSCCDMGQVPPEKVTRCLDNALAGDPEMGWSQFDCDSRGGEDCSCDYLSNENSSRYKSVCIDNDFEEPNGSEGSSSSGEGEGDSSGTEIPSQIDYWPILDTIRDTLIEIKDYTKEIAECLRYGTCKGLQGGDSIIVNVDGGSDSAFIKKTNVKLDSIYNIIAEGDTDIVKGLVALDSDLVKAIRQNPPLSDSSYIISTGDSISALNDTTRKWMKRIADSLGVGTDSLVAHIDSIVKHLPDTLIDSILKYQKYATDNFDSVLFGAGKGFSLIDSLIDSTVKYLSQGFGNFDSAKAILDSIYYGTGNDYSGDYDSTYEGLAGFDGFGGVYGDTVGDGTLGDIAAAAQAGYDDTTIAGMFPAHDAVDTSFGIPSVDSMAQVLQASIDSDYASLEGTLNSAFDSLRKDFQLINFDSLILEPLGMKIPNSNTCPDYIFDIDLSGAGTIYSNVRGYKWPLCTPLNQIGSSQQGRSVSLLPSLNVLQLVRLVLRIITALTCVYIGMWFIAGRK